jgi:hypothetical protein
MWHQQWLELVMRCSNSCNVPGWRFAERLLNWDAQQKYLTDV